MLNFAPISDIIIEREQSFSLKYCANATGNKLFEAVELISKLPLSNCVLWNIVSFFFRSMLNIVCCPCGE